MKRSGLLESHKEEEAEEGTLNFREKKIIFTEIYEEIESAIDF